jgi:nucleotidyltransferase/DNA polymerase involved in DNA repair
MVKEEIFRTLRLTCSIGIAPTRNFAKIASNMQKPDGLTVIPKQRISETIHKLPVEAICGVGRKTVELLHKLGIETVGDLARYDRRILKQCFGIYGESLSRTAQGESGAEVVSIESAEDEKSMGHEHTLSEDTTDMLRIRTLLLWLSQKTTRRLRERKMMGKIAVLKLRYSDFKTRTRRHTFSDFFWEEETLFQAANELFQQTYKRGRPVRLLGVTVSGLVRRYGKPNGQGVQISLFETEKHDRREKLYITIDALKDMHGERIIRRAATIGMKY